LKLKFWRKSDRDTKMKDLLNNFKLGDLLIRICVVCPPIVAENNFYMRIPSVYTSLSPHSGGCRKTKIDANDFANALKSDHRSRICVRFNQGTLRCGPHHVHNYLRAPATMDGVAVVPAAADENNLKLVSVIVKHLLNYLDVHSCFAPVTNVALWRFQYTGRIAVPSSDSFLHYSRGHFADTGKSVSKESSWSVNKPIRLKKYYDIYIVLSLNCTRQRILNINYKWVLSGPVLVWRMKMGFSLF